jgi:predicted Zn-dependent protease
MYKHISCRKSLCLFITISLFILIACATVPLTGRKQLNLIPTSQMLSMSFQQYDQVKKESRIATNTEEAAMIQRVGSRIAKATDRFLKEKGMKNTFQWEFILIEDDQTVNAWCMPGGKVAFYTGILPYTRTEAGVAVVMGHEISHAIAHHGNERMSQSLMVQLGGITLAKALEQKPEVTQNLWMSAFGLGAQLGYLLPYSRKHEYEADRIGLSLMAMAGYNPQEAVDFWTRMSQAGGSKPPEFMSTHPSDEKRVAAMKKNLPEAMRYYKK